MRKMSKDEKQEIEKFVKLKVEEYEKIKEEIEEALTITREVKKAISKLS